MADPAEERLGVYAEIDRENGVFPRGGPDGEVGSSCPFSLDGLCSDILKSILYRRYTLLDCRECVTLKTVKRFSLAASKPQSKLLHNAALRQTERKSNRPYSRWETPSYSLETLQEQTAASPHGIHSHSLCASARGAPVLSVAVLRCYVS